MAGLAPSIARGLWEPSLWDGVLQAVRGRPKFLSRGVTECVFPWGPSGGPAREVGGLPQEAVVQAVAARWRAGDYRTKEIKMRGPEEEVGGALGRPKF